MPAFIDLTGQRFGRLVVRCRSPARGRGARWVCDCDCGLQGTVRGDSLREGKSRSCGCLQVDVQRARNTKHGMWDGPVYRAWASMHQRCRPTFKQAKDYHGRGITVCSRWATFEPFRDDMAASFQPGLTLERLDNDKGYSPENCCWATRKAQVANRRARTTPQA